MKCILVVGCLSRAYTLDELEDLPSILAGYRVVFCKMGQHWHVVLDKPRRG